MLSSGDTYEGGYKDGKKHGKGKYKYYVDGRLTDVYDGRYRLGKRHGWGKMLHESGDVYVGNFKHDKASGQGKMVYSDEDGQSLCCFVSPRPSRLALLLGVLVHIQFVNWLCSCCSDPLLYLLALQILIYVAMWCDVVCCGVVCWAQCTPGSGWTEPGTGRER